MSDLTIRVPQGAELGTDRLVIVRTAAGTTLDRRQCHNPGALRSSPPFKVLINHGTAVSVICLIRL